MSKSTKHQEAKSEIRRSKAERRPKSEIRRIRWCGDSRTKHQTSRRARTTTARKERRSHETPLRGEESTKVLPDGQTTRLRLRLGSGLVASLPRRLQGGVFFWRGGGGGGHAEVGGGFGSHDGAAVEIDGFDRGGGIVGGLELNGVQTA